MNWINIFSHNESKPPEGLEPNPNREGSFGKKNPETGKFEEKAVQKNRKNWY